MEADFYNLKITLEGVFHYWSAGNLKINENKWLNKHQTLFVLQFISNKDIN